MKSPFNSIDLGAGSGSGRSCCYRFLPPASLILIVLLLGSVFKLSEINEKSSLGRVRNSLRNFNVKCRVCSSCTCLLLYIYFFPGKQSTAVIDDSQGLLPIVVYLLQNHRRPHGSEPLPIGIVSKTSNLEMRPLWGAPNKPASRLYQKGSNSSVSLLAMAVGIKQKDLIGKMVKKFLSSGFVVMFFHYDGNVDEWKQFQWNDLVIHVSAVNQTKWWFAKRFLHPDIVAEYSYVFLWDEDLGVDNFDPQRYVSIIRKEGLEISQPALDFSKSEVHHQITARVKGSLVHRRIYKPNANGNGCDENSTAPPCTGWIEVMAPVFSRAAWRCVWYMIQNTLIHAWGLDMQLGYCAQGDRTKNVGVVDAEYLIHYGRPTLGGPDDNKKSPQTTAKDHRVDVRRESYNEMKMFQRKWERAAKSDVCWIDPYPVNGSHQ